MEGGLNPEPRKPRFEGSWAPRVSLVSKGLCAALSGRLSRGPSGRGVSGVGSALPPRAGEAAHSLQYLRSPVGLTGCVSSSQTCLGPGPEPAPRACVRWTGRRCAASVSVPCAGAVCACAAAAGPWPAASAPLWSKCPTAGRPSQGGGLGVGERPVRRCPWGRAGAENLLAWPAASPRTGFPRGDAGRADGRFRPRWGPVALRGPTFQALTLGPSHVGFPVRGLAAEEAGGSRRVCARVCTHTLSYRLERKRSVRVVCSGGVCVCLRQPNPHLLGKCRVPVPPPGATVGCGV